ncbi:MAG: MG2 domain-containing protein, partial [Caldimonas sp.]
MHKRVGALLGLALAAAAFGADAASIVAVGPQGEVAQVRQVTVRFSEAVVAFGDLRLPDPFAVACAGAPPPGSGRWTSDRVWVYDFREALPPGTRCTASLRAEWKPAPGIAAGSPSAPASGGTVGGQKSFAFSTGGPAVVAVEPYASSEIEEDQHFLLRLNGAAVASTVTGNAWCEAEGIGERLPLVLVEGALREQVLKARRVKAAEATRVLLARCARPLPNGVAMRLIWGKGIAAVANPQVVTTIAQRFRYEVRAAFTAEFSCERERANAPCLPIRPMTLRFSAPVSRALAAQIRLAPAGGGASLAPVFDKDDKSPEVSEVAFPKTLPENTTFSVILPASVKDNAGRPLANASTFPLRVATGAAPPIAKFAAAPFGVIERDADAALPVTLRHVQGDLRPTASGGQVRIRRLVSDADIFAWYVKVQQYHETQMTAQALGRPPGEWFTFEDDTDARGRPVRRKVERRIGTREVSLLAGDAAAKRLDLPQLQGGDPRPFEVIGIPLPESGYHVVEIESTRLGQSLLDKRAPMFVRTGVLVTNLGVHFKLGRENSVVWVTTLDRARTVAGADVAVSDCRGRPLWTGKTDVRGVAVVNRALDASFEHCPADSGYFVTARRFDEQGAAQDVAFVFSSWQKGIESWRFNVPTGRGAEPDLRAATVFDRTLFRAGETVSMKHFIRVETRRGLAAVAPAQLPTRVKIVHRGSGQEFAFRLQWRGGGRSALTSWAIPPAARLGVYDVVLEREEVAAAVTARPADGDDRSHEHTWTSGSFRVEEFRVPLVDARLTGPKQAAVAPASLPIDIQINYFSGGPMGGAPLRASALLKSRSPVFSGYDEFTFDPPRDPKAAVGSSEVDDSEHDDAAKDGRLVADKVALSTDRNGAATFTLSDLPKTVRPAEVTAEVTFNDPNGETQTASTRVELWPSAVVLGVKAGSWASNRGRATFTVVALDTAGKPLAGQRVAVRGRISQTLSTRKRIVGGFYAYDNRTEAKELGPLCSGATDGHGLLQCEASLDSAGQVELIAESADAEGRVATAATSVWVTGQGELWFAQDNDDRIDVLPEKKRYEPGETARLQVRMPFREATALVAIEREGVIATQVVTLRGDDPTLELKIDSSWAPNVYVSVLAIRGRIRQTPWYSLFTWGWREPLAWWHSFAETGKDYRAPTAMVDLSKPAFKLGVAAIKVGLAGHALQVSVTADKPQYQVRQKVRARVRVSQGGRPMAGAHVAFAAVDEGLLALHDNDSWDLLDAMIKERAWGVETATAQSEIIGRRHYGRKAIAAGGGGGRGATRELFDTLLVWLPDVVLDGNGEATVEVPLNDSLTSFRLVAVADADVQKFGTGSATVRVTQDLQVLAGLPPLVRDGDTFSAMLTLRNTTAREMKVRATLQGTAHLPGPGGADIARLPLVFAPQDVVVPAESAKEVVWPVSVPAEAFSITWEAAADEAGAKDRLKVTQLVAAAVPTRVLQATLVQLDGAFSLPVAAPADALPASGPKRGGIEVAVQPRLTGALPGLRRFFATYPFTCLEQKTSKSVGLKDAALWADVAQALPTYLDSDGLASYFPPRAGDAAHGSDTLTAYVLAATHEAGFVLPAPAQEAMLAGLTAFVEGRIERRFWSPRPDRDVRKLAAIEALSRYGRAQVRMLGSINVTPNVWPTAAVIDWLNVLRRVDGVPERARRLAEANQILRSRLTYGGTTLKFSTEESDFWWWLMDSADANAARLVLAVLDDPAW